MKILLTNFHSGRGGGHVTYVIAIAKALAHRHAIYIATPATSSLYAQARTLPDVTLIAKDFPSKIKQLGSMWRAARRLRQLLEREAIDIVHVNGSADHRLVMLATAGLGRRKPRIVFTKHNSIAVGKGLANRIRARVATHHVIAVSDFTARMLRDTPYHQSGVTVVKNGVDIARFSPPDTQTMQRRRREIVGEANAGKLIIGTVTGFEWYKGTMDIVTAVAALPAALREQIHLVVVGQEPTPEQIATIDELGMRGNVTVAGLQSDVRSWIAAFDIGFVLSYAIETVSFACREMMAMAKPVIVTRYAGLPENITDSLDGWIVEPQAPAQLSTRLAEIVTRRGEVEAMGELARRRANAEFGESHFIDGTEAVYQRLLAV
ncbi:glycosyltransferase involved in cell wall biosynthesis [Paraburkholderia sp. GAS199]|uniref:glycosyltransferase family 4 protein n=1 Tax=Paraburkholderia sp. GAS199 TaxID=3035126 RepID=UPI003D1EC50D